MKTLHVGLRVTDVRASLAWYAALGYGVVGRVDLDGGVTLTMLRLPEDPAVSLELVHDPSAGAVEVAGIDHLVVQVDDLDDVLDALGAAGLDPEPAQRPGGADGPRTSWLTDPDGYRIELVQWPAGHPDGMTEADFA
jgi:lactoylglutathione lyase